MVRLIEGTDYYVKDNFFEKDYFTAMSYRITSNQIPWYFINTLNNYHKTDDTQSYFHHMVYRHQPLSQEYDFFQALWDLFDIKSLMRIKANCYPANDSLVVHPAHVDYDFTHKGAIIYVNSNDGFTILEDGTKIESIANRVLFFDPGRKHSSTNCTNSKARFNINVNYF